LFYGGAPEKLIELQIWSIDFLIYFHK